MECEATLHLNKVDLTLAEPAKQYSNDDDGNPNPWITVLPRHFKNRSYDTVIIKITDGLNLKETSHQKIGQAIMLAAQFTAGERLETFFKVREGPNLIAADTYRPSAKSKLLRLTSINIDSVSRPTSTYLAMGRDQVRGVVHGLDNLDDGSLQNSIQSHDRTILSAHRMGRSNTVLITFAGLHIPSYDSQSKTGTTAIVGQETQTTYTHKDAPSPTSLETLAIAETIRDHATKGDITIRTDSQGAIRNFRDNVLPPHVTTMLTDTMINHPHTTVTIESIPGHQGIKGNELAHQLARGNLNPGVPIPWPHSYDPYIYRASMHKQRKRSLKELRENKTLLNSPSYLLNREHSTIVRRAQTTSLMTEHIRHYISGAQGTPQCSTCGRYPSNAHQLWDCPNVAVTTKTALQTLPARLKPGSWEEWANPPAGTELLLWPLLVQHVKNVLGDEW
ncbi:hypothetical protein ISCGN_026934 [Ixodes scapularis]